MAAAAEAATVTVRLLPAVAAVTAALPALATAQAGHEGGVFAVQLQWQSVQWSVTRSYADVLRLHAQISSSSSAVLALEPSPLAVQCTDENQRQWAALTTATDGKEHDDDDDDVITDPAELEAYLKTLLASDLSPASKRAVLEFFQLGAETTSVPAMGPKLFEAAITKRASGRRSEWLSRPGLSLFVDIKYALSTPKRKWLVVRSNHLAYYSGADQAAPQDVLLFDSQTHAVIQRRAPGPQCVLRVSNDSHEIVFQLDSEAAAEHLSDVISDATLRSEWCRPHDFGSFAAVRAAQHARYLVDGAAYFAAVADALESAQHTIYIADWWLSPEVYLKRPCEDFPEYRLDRLLARKAGQGVKVYVILYKEVLNTMPVDSLYSKTALKRLHPNIQVLRHPDHGIVSGILYWAHHEKLVVVDSRLALLGGLDLCFGRYDDCAHPLKDQQALPGTPLPTPPPSPSPSPSPGGGITTTPPRAAARPRLHSSPALTHALELALPEFTALEDLGRVGITSDGDSPSRAGARPALIRRESSGSVYPGKDYSNPTVRDFSKLHEPDIDLIDRASVPRMPWHDVAVEVRGQAARDVAWHFVQRWNFIKESKAKADPAIPFLLPVADEDVANTALAPEGTCDAQILRSCSRWSSGISTEVSIYTAYIEAIEHAERFIYIENQFFVTTAANEPTSGGEQTLVLNRIGNALYRRIKRAHATGQRFRVVVVLPLVPAFTGTYDGPAAASLRIMTQRQLESIATTPHSLLGRLCADGIDPTEFIGFYGLRSWATLDRPRTTVVYVHSKMMIVDDRIAIIGSANINDRSMVGTRDSEIAVRIVDTAMVEMSMGGEPWQAGKFAHELRLSLFAEHVGAETEAERELVRDPVSATDAGSLWRERAKRNVDIFREVFHCVPDNAVTTWEQYRQFVAMPAPPRERADELLADVRGHVVEFPTQFLNGVNMLGTTITNGESLVSHEVFL